MRRTKMSRDQLHEAIHGSDRFNIDLDHMPGVWDETMQEVGMYDALSRFMDKASMTAVESGDPDELDRVPTPEEAAMILEHLVETWLAGFTSNTPDW